MGQVKAKSMSVGNILKIKKNLSEKPENFDALISEMF